MNIGDIEKIIPSLPEKVRDRIKYLCDNYKKTGDEKAVKLILEILEQFDEKREVLDLIKRMK